MALSSRFAEQSYCPRRFAQPRSFCNLFEKVDATNLDRSGANAFAQNLWLSSGQALHA
jgi:hypothetical protein